MLLLALDTAGPDCAVALAAGSPDGADILVRMTEPIGRGHAERLMPMVQAALAEAGLDFENLDRVAVTTGPGSFTGVRVGVAAARGLALALGISAVGVGSLAALAFEVMQSRAEGTAVAVLDAKRGELYAFIQDVVSRDLLSAPVATTAETLRQALAGVRRPLVLTGSGAPLLAAALDEADVSVFGASASADIGSVAALGLQAEPEGWPSPLYLRAADAKPQGDKAMARA